ncbi:MAG: B12-binding domain-containing radical SAM protein [Planctomycetaceae bacterium]|nr:B12-binding domain-containing radical SAM protein [Planctomycetaceae bacterium]
MPHVCFVPMSGFRIRAEELAELGMSMPGLGPRASAVGQLPALGVLTLAGMLPPDWSCCYQPIAQTSDEVIQRITKHQPDVVAVSALTASVNDAIRLSRSLRSNGLQTVIGGLHATALPDELQTEFDAVVVGSGESVWTQVCRDAEHKCLQPIYRATPAAQTLWPTPRFDLLPERPHRFTLQTQRGCPLACEFCAASRMLGRFSEKPLSHIARELQLLKTLRPRPLIELADDNTFAGRRDQNALLEVLKESGARWFTEADWRIGERPDLVNQLAAAGCMQILVGIESLCFRYPGMGNKQADLNRILKAIDNLQSAGVAVNGCFVLGADGESQESIDRLIAFIDASPLAEVQLTLQTPFPGTDLYRRLDHAGRLLKARDWSHYTLFDVTFEPDQMTVAELELAFLRAVESVFRAEAVQRRLRLRDEIWQINLRHRL